MPKQHNNQDSMEQRRQEQQNQAKQQGMQMAAEGQIEDKRLNGPNKPST